MIRAHLATFPPRRRILRRVYEAIMPQVERLFVVLNGYDSVPGYLAKDERVTAVIPDRDVKDAGKFWFKPEPDDIVFTIDDDIGYPPNYVSSTLEQFEAIGMTGNVVGYQANAWDPKVSDKGWVNYLFHEPLDDIRGISLIGTGTLCARGDAIAPLSEIEPEAGACDIAYSLWLFRNRILPWALPRPQGWLSNDLPKNLWKSSLFKTAARGGHPAYPKLLPMFASRWPHSNIRHDQYLAGMA